MSDTKANKQKSFLQSEENKKRFLCAVIGLERLKNKGVYDIDFCSHHNTFSDCVEKHKDYYIFYCNGSKNINGSELKNTTLCEKITEKDIAIFIGGKNE